MDVVGLGIAKEYEQLRFFTFICKKWREVEMKTCPECIFGLLIGRFLLAAGVFSEAYGPGGPNGYSIFYGEPANAYGASYGVQYGQAGPVYGDPNGYAYASPLAQDSAGGAYGAYGSTYGNTYGYGDTYGYGQLNEPKPWNGSVFIPCAPSSAMEKSMDGL